MNSYSPPLSMLRPEKTIQGVRQKIKFMSEGQGRELKANITGVVSACPILTVNSEYYTAGECFYGN